MNDLPYLIGQPCAFCHILIPDGMIHVCSARARYVETLGVVRRLFPEYLTDEGVRMSWEKS